MLIAARGARLLAALAADEVSTTSDVRKISYCHNSAERLHRVEIGIR